MAIRTYRPYTPSIRYRTTIVNDDLTTDKPHKPLVSPKKRSGGRRNVRSASSERPLRNPKR